MNTRRFASRPLRSSLEVRSVRSVRSVRLSACAAVVGSLVLGGLSSPAQARGVLAAQVVKPTIVTIIMGPVKYNPSVISVPAGKPVILRFVNKATIDHEALIGDAKEQDEHEKIMKEMPGMAHHGVKGFVDVKPGKSKDIAWTFPKAGVTFIGCHKPAHYKGGMKLRVVVKSSTGIA